MPDEPPDEFEGVDVLLKYQILAERRIAAERRRGVRRVIYFRGFEPKMPPPLAGRAVPVAKSPNVRGLSALVAGGSAVDARLQMAALAETVRLASRLAARRTPDIPQGSGRSWRTWDGQRRRF
jgi:hypothetical protein